MRSRSSDRKVWISKVQIRNFKSYVDAVVTPLRPGVNIIVGRNGSGKSNLLRALSFALTDIWYPGKRNKDKFYPERRSGPPSVAVTVAVSFAPDDVREITVERGMTASGKDYFKCGFEELPIELYALEIMSLGFPFHSGFFFINQAEAFLACDDPLLLAKRISDTLPSSEFKTAIIMCKNFIQIVLPGFIAEIEEATEKLRKSLDRKRAHNPMVKVERLKEDILAHDLALAMIEYKANLDVIQEMMDGRYNPASIEGQRKDLKERLLGAQLQHDLTVRELEGCQLALKEKEGVAQRLDKQIDAKNQQLAEHQLRLSELENSLSLIIAARDELEASLLCVPSPPLPSPSTDDADSSASSSITRHDIARRNPENVHALYRKWTDTLLQELERARKLGFDPADDDFHYVSPTEQNWAENLDRFIKKNAGLKAADDQEAELLYCKKDKNREELEAAEKELETLKQKEREVKKNIRDTSDAMADDQCGRLEDLKERRRRVLQELSRKKQEMQELQGRKENLQNVFLPIAGGRVMEGLENFAMMIKELRRHGTAQEKKLVRDEYLGVVADLIEFDEHVERGMCILAGGSLWHQVTMTSEGAMKLSRIFNIKKLGGFVDFISLDLPAPDGGFIPDERSLRHYGNVRRLKGFAKGHDFLGPYLFETSLVCEDMDVIKTLRDEQPHWVKRVKLVTLNGESYAPQSASMMSVPNWKMNPMKLRKELVRCQEGLDRKKTELAKLEKDMSDIRVLEDKRTEEAQKLAKKRQELLNVVPGIGEQVKSLEHKVDQLKERELKIACRLDESELKWKIRAQAAEHLQFAQENPPNEELSEQQIKEMTDECQMRLKQKIKTGLCALQMARKGQLRRERGRRPNMVDEGASAEEDKLTNDQATCRAKVEECEKHLEVLKAKHAALPAEMEALTDQLAAATEDLRAAKETLDAAQRALHDMETSMEKAKTIEVFHDAKNKAEKFVEELVVRCTGLDQRERVEGKADRLMQTLRLKMILEERKKLKRALDELKKSLRTDTKVVDNMRLQAEVIMAGEEKLKQRLACLDDFQDWIKKAQKLYDMIVRAWNPKLDDFRLLWRVAFKDVFESFVNPGDRLTFNVELDTGILFDEGVMHLDFAKPKIVQDDEQVGSALELSNGEKSLVTFVLVTSLFATLGVPTCLLDEVDQCLSENRRKSMAEAVSKLMGQMGPMQLLFTTFSVEIPREVGETFHVVETPAGADKLSTTREVTKDEALGIIGRGAAD